MTHLLPEIRFENNFLSATPKWFGREKRDDYQVIKNELDLLKIMTLLESNAQPEKQNLFLMNGNEERDVLSDSRKCYRARGQR